MGATIIILSKFSIGTEDTCGFHLLQFLNARMCG